MTNKWIALSISTGLLLIAAGCEGPPASEGYGAMDGESAEQGTPSASPATKNVTLEAGTPIRVRTTNALSTAAVKTGESFAASLEDPIVVGTTVIAAKGAPVKGVVVSADPGGKVKRTAGLAIRLTEVQAADGGYLAVSTDTYGVQARSSKKKDAKKVGIASGIGAAVGAIVGGGKGAAIGAGAGAGAGTAAVVTSRGDAAVIGSESVITFQLTESVTLERRPDGWARGADRGGSNAFPYFRPNDRAAALRAGDRGPGQGQGQGQGEEQGPRQ